jgi:hypothetical protein
MEPVTTPARSGQRNFAGSCLATWKPNMKPVQAFLVLFALSLACMTTAQAEDKCESTEHNVSHDIGGKKYVCDKCVILGCETGGSNIGKCTRTTKYTNCVEPPADKKK